MQRSEFLRSWLLVSSTSISLPAKSRGKLTQEGDKQNWGPISLDSRAEYHKRNTLVLLFFFNPPQAERFLDYSTSLAPEFSFLFRPRFTHPFVEVTDFMSALFLSDLPTEGASKQRIEVRVTVWWLKERINNHAAFSFD